MSAIFIKALHVANKPEIKFECVNITLVNSFSPSWSTDKAYGKMDDIPYYANTTRSMKVYFESKVEEEIEWTAKKLNEAVSNLMKFQYPRYTEGTINNTILAPPFFQIRHVEEMTDGNFKLYNPIQGYISGEVQIAPGHSDGIVPDFSSGLVRFGAGLTTSKGTENSVETTNSNSIYERYYKITFNFTVLHEIVPGWRGSEFHGPPIFHFDKKNRGDQTRPPGGDGSKRLDQFD